MYKSTKNYVKKSILKLTYQCDITLDDIILAVKELKNDRVVENSSMMVGTNFCYRVDDGSVVENLFNNHLHSVLDGGLDAIKEEINENK